jgi:uncharacterized membrane protein
LSSHDLVLIGLLIQILLERNAGHLQGHSLLLALVDLSQLLQNRLHLLFLSFLLTNLLQLRAFKPVKGLTEEKLVFV